MNVTNIHIHFGRRFPCEMSNSASIEYKKNTHTYTECKRGILIFLFCTSAFRPCRVFVDWENAWENLEWCGLQSFIKPIQRIIQTNSYQINQRFLSLDFISEFFKQQMLLMKLMIMTAFENNVWRWWILEQNYFVVVPCLKWLHSIFHVFFFLRPEKM